MLVIRNAQMDAFATVQRERFEQALAECIVDQYPEKTFHLDDAALRARIHEAVSRSEQYGFTRTRESAVFVVMTFEIAEHFDSDPAYAALHRILNLPNISAAEKAAKLEEAVFSADPAVDPR